MSNDSKLKTTISLLPLIVAIIVLLFGNNLVGRLLNKPNKEHQEKVEITDSIKKVNKYKVDTLDIIIEDKKLPYLVKIPIIDKGLFVENYYTKFRFGGVNLEMVKFNVMSNEGETLNIEFDANNNFFEIPIFEEPQLEFSYKEKIYQISILNKNIQSFHYSIFEISNSRMNLIKSKSQFVRN